MRNLKRALSLALASVMLLGMMVVGTSAASYPDVKDSDNIEAIEVLNAVKVMVGDRGNFRPDAAVNRHEMAAIMARLVLGEDAETYVGNHPFTDVYPWADKYVAACYENGLINGTSKTTFSGNQPLTAVQAAAMMLRALGYEDLSKGASDWRVPVTAKANEVRLFKGVASSPNTQLNRNQVAQLALNTLEADVVVSDIEKDIIVEGIVTIPGKVTYNKVEDKEGLDYNGKDDETLQLCEKLYDGKLTLQDVGGDNYGRPGKGWQYKTTDVIATRDDSPILTYTSHVKAADVVKDLKSYKNATATQITIDGTDGSGLTATIDAIAGAIDSASGKGVTVTVYADDDKEITHVVAINSYIGQVTRVKTEDGETTVTVSKKAGGSKSANTFETEDFEKDDYVIYTVGKDGIETMAAAEKVTGEVTSTSGTSYLRLEGTRYDFAKDVQHKDGAPAAEDKIDAYLDAAGNILYTEEVESAADQYLYVKGADKHYDTVSINAIFSDGTVREVTVDSDTLVNDTTNLQVAASGVKLSTLNDTQLSEAAGKMSKKVFAYTESDGEYKLTVNSNIKAAVTSAAQADNAVRYDIEKNNTTLYISKKYTDAAGSWGANNSANATVSANNSTVYVMVDDGKTYTGFRNVPSMTSVDLIHVVNDDNNSIVDLVFITDSEDGDSANSFFFYIADVGEKDTFKKYTRWNEAYVNGEKQVVETTDAVTISQPGLYKATRVNDEDRVTAVDPIIGWKVDVNSLNIVEDGNQAVVADGGVLNLEGANPGSGDLAGQQYSYDDETLFVSIDVDGDVTASNSMPTGIKKSDDVAAGDSVYYVYVAEVKGDSGTDKTTAKVVYVVESVVTAAKAKLEVSITSTTPNTTWAATDTVTFTAASGTKTFTLTFTAATAAGGGLEWTTSNTVSDYTVAFDGTKLTVEASATGNKGASHPFGTITAAGVDQDGTAGPPASSAAVTVALGTPTWSAGA